MCGQVFGKNYGVAYNCNKWVLNGIGNGNVGINGGIFDVQKLFHLYKPNYDRHSANNGNQQNPDKNPTLSIVGGIEVTVMIMVDTIGIDQK